ncbi:hypothetical protein OG982_29865 [Streptomyces sp. NBC_01551]|uniref:hypothetical protein n=1 Tax=Streptomyces sp. NBC_01551 TaxID=2975876 RepID=UPI0022539EC0|nr:hypothetical protein [Streptomyces sp. NBC_01551]MCX4529851.1 hypothetical protein [Streptomyces sp. NBC_01551]
MSRNRQRLHSDRVLDMIVFLSILAAGVVLTLLGVSAGSIAGIAAALATLYGAWTTTRERQSRPPSGRGPDDRAH